MSQTLQYKGYDGSVELSAEDRVLHGSLLGIRDAVTYEGVDVDSLESNFRAAVDEYLAFCSAEGKVPDQPFKGSFNVRVGPDLHKRAALLAEGHNQRLNAVVSKALEEFFRRPDSGSSASLRGSEDHKAVLLPKALRLYRSHAGLRALFPCHLPFVPLPR